jgi:hypothetical protein
MARPVMRDSQRSARESQRQMVGRLSQTMHRPEGDGGRRNGREPTIGEELRQGRQEILTIGHDLADLGQDLQKLVQQEMLLARDEMKHQMGLSTRALAWGVIGLIFMSLKLAVLSLAGIFALALFMPVWAAALIVAGVLFIVEIVAGLMAYRRFRQIHLVPQRTIESVKEDLKWISNHLKSNGP